MSTQNLDGIYSYPVAVDLSASQYQAVVINTSGQAALAGANAQPDGVLDNLPIVTDYARVISKFGAVVKARYGGVVTLGALLTTDATGRLVVATSGQFVCAKADRFAGVVGDIQEVLWYGRGGGVSP